jgi:hypothetical protein
MVHDNRHGLRDELQLPLEPRQLRSQGDGRDRSFITIKPDANRLQLPNNVGETPSGIRERRIVAVHLRRMVHGACRRRGAPSKRALTPRLAATIALLLRIR